MGPVSWHSIDINDTAELLDSDTRTGLSAAEAELRLRHNGPNRLQEAPGRGPLSILADQFRDFMVLVLFAATGVSLLLGEFLDAGVILGIIVLNAILGFLQEIKAERSLNALKVLAAPRATVIRDSQAIDIPAERVVTGDVLLVDSGTKVAADARLIEAAGLETEESSLTGESVPVTKSVAPVTDDRAAVADQTSMIFAGTTIVRGRGKALVVATAMSTQVGQIAGLLTEPRTDKTPLQHRLEVLGRQLVIAAVVVVGMVVAVGLWRGEPLFNMFLAGVSLAVAAVPEGLPAVVTVSLALGVQRMSAKNAIVRRLPAVETLGTATVICSDKTGTITVNEMTVREIFAGGEAWSVSGEGYEPVGEIRSGRGRAPAGRSDPPSGALGRTLFAAALCNNSTLIPPERARIRRRSARGDWAIQGDPTEGALIVAAAKLNLWRDQLEGNHPRVAEIPFESDRRRMTVVVSAKSGRLALTKGAPDVVIPRCSAIMTADGKAAALDEHGRADLERIVQDMADRALRVLALAGRELRPGTWDNDSVESGLVLYGLVGMIDPPRPEVQEAVAKCMAAGIRVIMITGDHAATARAVAGEAGILARGGEVISGHQLENMSEDELAAASSRVNVFARVSPHHKLKIVRALRKAGHIVAMTGDGVNDAPAVREADIGVAMGRTGTDVTRETSDIILADDNFATIVAAVEEGRGIYDNIRRFIRYLLSCNVGEIVAMFFASLLGLPLPLMPAQILLLNLVTDGLPATALGVEKADPRVMSRLPRNPRENIFAGGMGRRILLRGFLIGLVTLGVFWLALDQTRDLQRARTMAFSTLVVSQLLFVFRVRGGSSRGLARLVGNPYLLLAVASSLAVLIAVLYVPAFRPAFRTVALTGPDWLVVLGASVFGAASATLRWAHMRRS